MTDYSLDVVATTGGKATVETARAERLHEALDEQAQWPRVAGAWLWLDGHSERTLARGELPDAVVDWCRALRASRAALLRTARHQRRIRR